MCKFLDVQMHLFLKASLRGTKQPSVSELIDTNKNQLLNQ